MITIALDGYENLMPIHHSENSRVYRAQRVSDSQPVILKFLAQDYPTSEQIRRYKQEYHLTCQLDSPGIVKAYSLEQWQKSYAIVFEDFGGISLRELLQEREQREQLSLSEFLDLAIAISESLAEIHAQNIIHKDINPANIVFNPQTQEVKIIDFGIATQLSRENPTLKNPNVLEGTLTYISPEQTGRMNRDLDYRTDFYSLGVTFYEMLTGKLPFDSTDPLELVHCHIAKMPEALGNREPGTGNREGLPKILSDIVLKLMAKNAEDRYQSAWGLKADLEHCQRQLKETGTIVCFALGQQDISDRFSIPQKLYGRSAEIATLLAAFERVAETGNVELMMVTGYSGIGKSSLVQELYKPIAARRGYFLSGKFDQFQRNIPYSALVEAFRGLIGQLLAETDAELQRWREKLLEALGVNGQVIIDIIPEVELIIGQQPPVQGLEANESQNRFNLAFGNFINVFCNKEHPLTLFIDDLQWADLATLKLLKQMLVEGTTQYLFLLGAYRHNEVDASHPLAITLEQIRENNHVIQQITLQPLPLEQINALIDDTLQPSPKTPELAGLVWRKTGGNPFFVNEFLQALYSENLLQFERRSRTWQWDLLAIEARGFTDNVVELMVKKLQKLPPSSQDILSIAACCGAEFDLEILTWVAEKSAQETFKFLKVALDRGLILPRSELDENLLVQYYKFAHDRIQQAAYAMIPEAERAIVHYRIGKRLLQKISPQAREQSIFKLVSQLNYGTDLISEPKERERLAKLNLIASSKAKAATAYQAALEYAKVGLALLEQNCWQRQYKICLNFHELATELSVLCGDFAEFERLCSATIEHSRSSVETVNVYAIKIKCYISQTRYIEAIEAGTKFLASMGIILPTAPTQEDIQTSSRELETLIKNKKIEDFADLPKMQSPEKIAVVRIANSLIPATVATASSLLFLLLVELSVKFSIQYGNTEASGFAYGLYGHICCNIKHNIDTGVKFGELGLEVVSRFDAQVIKPEILNIVGVFIWHHKYPLKESVTLAIDGYTTALETGNHEFAGYCAGMFCISAFWSGQPLVKLEQDVRGYSEKLMQLNQLRSGNQCRIYWQTILNLLGNVNHPTILSGEALSEPDFLSENNDVSSLGTLYSYKLLLCYLFGDIEAARTSAIEGRKYCMTIAGSFMEAGFYFYDALTSLRAVTLGLEESSEALQRVEDYQTKLQHWAEYAPMNYQHKVDLVAAEKCRVLGQKAEAIELYNQAIYGANQSNYIQEEALANELLAKFYLDWHQEKVARMYMMDAHYCYSRWEAMAKVKQLEENYPQLCQSSIVRTATTSNSATINQTVNQSTSYFTTSNSSSQLDLSTMMKASQAIAGEIVLSRLLTQLIQILMENTGARSGYLILETEGELLIEAAASADGEIAVLQSMSLESVKPDGSSPLLCPAIVNYVARTYESVVLHDAQHEGNFTTQSYIQNFQVQSVLSVPLLNQGQLRGVVYLENNLTTGAFTQERVEIVKLLSGQAAIAISNAQLYGQLQESKQQITRLYEASKRFVPSEFLSFLDKQSIVDVELGDRVQREMTVLFSDIRDFTTISEQMNPEENFAFINEYLGYMEPQIQKYGGFIDKYIGDAIMALFPSSADDALSGAIAMLEELKQYNSYRQEQNLFPVRIGIGLHTGMLMLGTVGGMGRMDGTVIGDAVNLSSRVEGLTKTYGASLLITYETWQRLNDPLKYDFRFMGKVKAKGKTQAVGLFEVFSADPPELRDAKMATKEKFERGILLYHEDKLAEAGRLFQECLEYYQGDRAARSYLDLCHKY